MIYCPSCHAHLVENAKFCHQCGAHVEIPLHDCPHCLQKNPLGAKRCYFCLEDLYALDLNAKRTDTKTKKGFRFDFSDTYNIEEQIKSLFFDALQKITTWYEPTQASHFLNLVIKKRFTDFVERHTRQAALEFSTDFHKSGESSRTRIERDAENMVFHWVLYFLINECPDEISPPLSSKILQHEKFIPQQSALKKLIADYLDFDNEKLIFYYNAIEIPSNKLESAHMNFLFTAKDEYPFFISDLSLSGTNKEGFSMTPFAIYWRSDFNAPKKIYYHTIENLQREKNWVTINKEFFNAKKHFNFKLLLLLERLRLIFN